MRNKISFLGQRKPLAIINLNKLRSSIEDLALSQQCSIISLQYVLVSKSAMLDLNKKHLGHNYDTDIITFNLSEKKNTLDAEIYLCPQTIFDNALGFNTSPAEELLRVLFHGPLHLIGFNDKTPAEQKVMRGMEEHCLNLYQNSVAL